MGVFHNALIQPRGRFGVYRATLTTTNQKVRFPVRLHQKVVELYGRKTGGQCPNTIIDTLSDHEYMASVREKLNIIAAFQSAPETTLV